MLEFAAARSARADDPPSSVELRPRIKVKGQMLELPTLRIGVKVVKP